MQIGPVSRTLQEGIIKLLYIITYFNKLDMLQCQYFMFPLLVFCLFMSACHLSQEHQITANLHLLTLPSPAIVVIILVVNCDITIKLISIHCPLLSLPRRLHVGTNKYISYYYIDLRQ